MLAQFALSYSFAHAMSDNGYSCFHSDIRKGRKNLLCSIFETRKLFFLIWGKLYLACQDVRQRADRIRKYLYERTCWEQNPFYRGRYQVALATVINAYNNLSHPYEVAEILFRGSRMHANVQQWLVERCERFPYLHIQFDGSLGGWKEPQFDVGSLPAKKPVQSVRPARDEKAGAA